MGTFQPITYTLRDGTTVLIRPSHADDAARLVEMTNAIVAEKIYTMAEPGEFSATEEQMRARILEYAAADSFLYMVAEVEGRVVGWIDFANGRVRKSAHTGHLAIYLDHDWRERGVGSLLLGRLLEWATAHPLIEKVRLAVFSNNDRAIRAYTKAGFREEGRCPRNMKFPNGEYVDDILMYQFVKKNGDDHDKQ
jgi:RimJ/RimL family protein N-acetyltransferase